MLTRTPPGGELLILATLLTLLAACSQPDLTADSTGQLIEPSLERYHPLTEIVDSCGTTTEVDPSLTRLPYVQRVTHDAASILWTSISAAESVELWEPGGAPRTLESNAEETTFLAAESTQRAVRVEGLEPSTVHCYRVVRDGEVVFGPSGFRTAPANDDLGPIDVLAFGDSGRGTDAQLALRAQMETAPADLIIHTGDLAYDNGTMPEIESWVFGVYDELFTGIPFFPTIGNHDDSTAQAAPYLEAFELPTNAGSTDETDIERRYSFDWGPAHFVALDTERMDDEQAIWLENDLAATDRPWKIVYGHHPPYSSGRHGSANRVREILQPVLERQGVQLVLSGHDHHYERTEAIGGVTYLVTGGGGDSRPTGESSWTAFAAAAVHFVTLHIEEGVLRGYAVDGSGRLFDSFRLRR